MEEKPLNKTITVAPLAYIKSLMYFQRFASDFVEESEFKLAYGLLLGFINYENELVIEDFVPIRDFGKEMVRFEEFDQIFEHVENINEEYDDDEFPMYVIGWARNNLMGDIEPSLIDKQNQLYFQTAIHPSCLCWVFDHENLTIDHGFKLFSYPQSVIGINLASKLKELSFKFSKEVYFDELIDLAIKIEQKRTNSEIIIRGVDETLLGEKIV